MSQLGRTSQTSVSGPARAFLDYYGCLGECDGFYVQEAPGSEIGYFRFG